MRGQHAPHGHGLSAYRLHCVGVLAAFAAALDAPSDDGEHDSDCGKLRQSKIGCPIFEGTKEAARTRNSISSISALSPIYQTHQTHSLTQCRTQPIPLLPDGGEDGRAWRKFFLYGCDYS